MKREITPLRAIRQHCIECCNGDKTEVRLCDITRCALHGFRMGHKPKEEGDGEPVEEGDTDERQ